MTILQIITKHKKLWQKFLANCFYFKTSKQRRLIKIFKGFWFLILWPSEIILDLISLGRRPLKALSLGPQPKILIIKIDQLGDVLFSTFLLPALKSQWPESQIDYLVDPKSAAILKNNPQVNQIIPWSNCLLTNIPGRQKISLKIRWQKFKTDRRLNRITKKELKKTKYDLVINGRAFWPSSNFLGRALGKKLIAFDISQFSGLADIVIPYDLKTWEENNYKKLLSALGVAPEIINRIEARGQFYNFNPLPTKIIEPYWLLAPVSYDPERTWPIGDWLKFIELWLTKKPEIKIIISGLKEQANWLDKIKDYFLNKPSLLARLNFRSDLSLGQLAELIKNSRGLVGLDSFPAHLAIACKKPISCLLNSQLFYLPSLSRQKLVDGRSILPNLPDIKILDLKLTKPETLLKSIA